ncbi:Uncharacterised protein [Mycobacteroides abscessus]|nr:Uncharacterised protein [Mycobacteroides abscessus]
MSTEGTGAQSVSVCVPPVSSVSVAALFSPCSVRLPPGAAVHAGEPVPSSSTSVKCSGTPATTVTR